MTNDSKSTTAKSRPDIAAWKEIVAKYQKSSTARALWQIINTLVPYGFLWYLMYRSASISLWLTLPLAALAGGFLVWGFIIFHYWGEGWVFKSPAANNFLGLLCGMLIFTQY